MLLYFATTNPGKLRDFAAAAGEDDGFTFEPLPGLAGVSAPPEDEPTFTGNAIAKAVSYSLHAPGSVVLADDSGIEVDALGGAPGVRSARFADDRQFRSRAGLSPDQRNNLCLLDALASTREEQRTARYRCVIAAAQDGHLIATGEGAVEGEILAVPRGNGGFGYDPIFLLPEEGLSMGEMAPGERLRLSHRGLALRDLLPKLAAVGQA